MSRSFMFLSAIAVTSACATSTPHVAYDGSRGHKAAGPGAQPVQQAFTPMRGQGLNAGPNANAPYPSMHVTPGARPQASGYGPAQHPNHVNAGLSAASPWTQHHPNMPAYLLAPGDELEIIVYADPELSQEEVIVAPDGRISMPYTGSVMAASRTLEQVRQDLIAQLAKQLYNPDLDVILKEVSPRRVFVGGEVGTPGAIEVSGQVDPLQAIIMAGGLTLNARAGQVILIRRMPSGQVQNAVLDVKEGLVDPRVTSQWGPLRPNDVVYVTRKRIANLDEFIRDLTLSILPAFINDNQQ